MKQFPNLKEFKVSKNNIETLLPIARVKSIKGFFASGCGMRDLNRLFNPHSFQCLQKLDLSGNPISDISKLIEAQRLSTLLISGCELNGFGHVLGVVKRFKYLKTLDMRLIIYI